MLLSKFPRIIAALSFINYAFHLKTYILRLSRDALSDVLWITIIAIVAHHVTWYHSRLIITQGTQTQWVILASVSQQLLIPRPCPAFQLQWESSLYPRGEGDGVRPGVVCAHILYIAGGTWHVTLLTHGKHLLFLVFSGFSATIRSEKTNRVNVFKRLSFIDNV